MYVCMYVQALTYTKTELKNVINQIKENNSYNVYEYFNTSTLMPATICISSVRVIDALERLRFLKETLNIASGK